MYSQAGLFMVISSWKAPESKVTELCGASGKPPRSSFLSWGYLNQYVLPCQQMLQQASKRTTWFITNGNGLTEMEETCTNRS